MDIARLRKIMLEKGVNQQELALRSGISAPSLSRKLKGISEFRIKEVKSICSVLEITDLREASDIFLH